MTVFGVRPAVLGLVAALSLGGCGRTTSTGSIQVPGPVRIASVRLAAPTRPAVAARVRVVVRKQTVGLVDRRRRGRGPRRLQTIVRYPTGAGRRYPLIVFAHGFALTPRSYRQLLYAWASAGYVVAAPVFPGESATAPGGPDRSDLINEPADLRFVIDRLLGAARRGAGGFARFLAPGPVAIAGHSDGGDAALSVGYGPGQRSRRVAAVIILAGAYLPTGPAFAFPAGGPPLLAVQGDRDQVNPPGDTRAFYRRARAPKALLHLIGAGHYGPYTGQQPQGRLVAGASIALLDHVLKHKALSRGGYLRAGRRPGISRFQIDGVG